MIKRVLKEQEDLLENPIEGVKVQFQMGKLVKCYVIMEGPKGSLYYGGKFKFIFNITNDYPFKPPKVEFLTNILHIYIREKHGYCKGCYDLLGILHDQWSPALTFSSIIKTLKSVYFEDKDIDKDHRNKEAYKLMTTNKKLYQKKINEVMAQEYAKDHIQSFIAYKKHFYKLFNTNPDQIFIDMLY